MISERIMYLRERNGYTQVSLATKLGITRSSVNAWEMGISIPSTQCLIQLASLFNVSIDYILCISSDNVLNIEGLNESEIEIINSLVNYFKELKGK